MWKHTINIFQIQYIEKKYPMKLKYFPFKVFDQTILSSIVFNSINSRNSCLESSSSVLHSCFNCETSCPCIETLFNRDQIEDVGEEMAFLSFSFSIITILFFFIAIMSKVWRSFRSKEVMSDWVTTLIKQAIDVYGYWTAPKPDNSAIIVTPMTPTRLMPCSIDSIPCFGLRIGKGSPIFQKRYINMSQTTTENGLIKCRLMKRMLQMRKYPILKGRITINMNSIA